MAPNRRLKQARELRGWSQAKVAEQIGTDATTVSRWERGLFLPTPHFRERLCALFGSNAEELGLLESTRLSQQQATTEDSEKSNRLPTHEKGDLSAQTETSEQDEVPPSQLSSLNDIDTFTYILQSASQEQQAYMLWEHAYVRVLQDQRDDAQHLGEASANVFEQVSHPNAKLVRTWLKQQGLVPSSPTPSNNPPQKTGRKKSSWSGLGGMGLFLLSIVIISLLISGLAFYWSTSSSFSLRASLASSQSLEESEASPVPTHAGQQAILPSSPQPQPSPPPPTPSPLPSKANIYKIPTPLPHVVPSPTALPQPTPSPSPSVSGTSLINSNVIATANPSQLTPHTCNQEGTGYRCTVTLKLYATTTFNWQVSNTALPARFNPSSGTITPGQGSEMIIYIDTSSCTYGGTIIFKFSLPNSTSAISISRAWQC